MGFFNCLESGQLSDLENGEPRPKKQKEGTQTSGTEANNSNRQKKKKKKKEKKRKKKSLMFLKKKSCILNASNQNKPTTVTEARQMQKLRAHPQFGGKVPNDLHAECKETIDQLRKEIEELKEKLKEKSSG